MRSIKEANLVDISKDTIVRDLGTSMKATLENIDKSNTAAPWRKHFRPAMCLGIGG